jgi:4'-phosphopantetheinyl transferase
VRIKEWTTPNHLPVLGDRDIHVWWARSADLRKKHEVLLDEVERGRHARLQRQGDRTRFALGCALVRLAASGYLGYHPGHVPLTRSCPECGEPHGKPRIVDGSGLELSVSHSGDRVVVALRRSKAVGVDVEQVTTRLREPEKLASFALSPRELASLLTLPPEQWRIAFLSHWTQKEAVLKATGEGLRVPLKRLEVSGHDDEPRLLAWMGRPDAVDSIRLYPLCPGPDHVASLAAIDCEDHQRVLELDARTLLEPEAPER